MGARGPAPMPASVHQLYGNASKKPAGQLEAAAAVEVKIPEAPPFLSERARSEWDRIMPHLERLGLIADIYLAAAAAYCVAFADWVHARTQVQTLEDGYVASTPQGYKQIAAWLVVANQAEDRMRRWAAEFGLSPSSRMRVTQGANPQGSLFPEDDPMAAYTAAASNVR